MISFFMCWFYSSNWCQCVTVFMLIATDTNTQAGSRRLAERKWEWERYLFRCYRMCVAIRARKTKFEILVKKTTTAEAKAARGSHNKTSINGGVRQAKWKQPHINTHTHSENTATKTTIKKEKPKWLRYSWVYKKWLGCFVFWCFCVINFLYTVITIWPRRVVLERFSNKWIQNEKWNIQTHWLVLNATNI